MNQSIQADFEPQYKTVNQALRSAYYTAARAPFKPVMSDDGGADMSWEDHAASSGMIMAAIRESLSATGRQVIDALYIVPESKALDHAKSGSCKALADDICLTHPGDKAFINYLVQVWAGYPETKNLVQWAEELRKNEKTLRRWKIGWDTPRGKESGVFPILDRKLDTARGMLAPAFRVNGWIY